MGHPGREGKAMIGAIIIAVLLLVVIPVSVLMSGAVGAAILGYFTKKSVDANYEGSELLDL